MKDLDQSIDTLENARFNWLYANEITQMSKDSIFSLSELISIVMVYHKMVLVNGAKAKFMTIPQLAALMEDLFEITDRELITSIVFRVGHNPGYTHPEFFPDRHVNLQSFVKLFTIYFTRDLELKMEFAFSVRCNLLFKINVNLKEFLNISLQVYDKGDNKMLNGEEGGFYIKKFFEGEDEDEALELLLVRMARCLSINYFIEFHCCRT